MELADKIQNAAVASVMIQTEEGATKILSNMEVNLAEYVDLIQKRSVFMKMFSILY